MLDAKGAWVSNYQEAGAWMKIDLGSVRPVAGIVVQGHHILPEFVTKFNIMYSEDGEFWFEVAATFNGGDADTNVKTEVSFPSPVTARYVRIIAREWVGRVAMRAGLLVCQAPLREVLCPSVAEVNSAEVARTYSSTFGAALPGKPWAASALDSTTGWVAASSSKGEWMTIDLGQVETAGGVVLQGREDGTDRVTSFRVSVSQDGVLWEDLAGPLHGLPEADEVQQFERVKVRFPKGHGVAARFVKIMPEKWVGGIGLRAGVLVCEEQPETPKCAEAVELNLPESQRSYSSVFCNGKKGEDFAVSMLDSGRGWTPNTQEPGQHVTFDFGAARAVAGTETQSNYIAPFFVKQYSVQYSIDGKAWFDVDDASGGSVKFTGNGPEYWRRAPAIFPKPVTARFVRMIFHSWEGEELGPRVAPMVCEEKRETPQCEVHAVVNPPEHARRYSGVIGASPVGTGAAQSMLGSKQAWSAALLQPGEWLVMDLGRISGIAGAVIQGRADSAEWVTKYYALYGNDGVSFTEVNGTGTWTGTDKDLEVQTQYIFDAPVLGRFLRLEVIEWSGWISMRAGAIVCKV